ncbi:hypothetical protein [uncultured Pseudacidovorax sp.]|uniref:hypothetical protein n=1 Tax=uncultured Pseudacidovorax sp. TaxID=679313 RepID=UPI0025FE20EC|nr:hypothetical protein [uncultured Pseudacidovorax sp.]
MSQDKQDPTTAQAVEALERTIDQAKAVAAEIRQAADNLAVVNTVLEEVLPDHVQVGEVAQALDQSGQVEEQINRSAEVLDALEAAQSEVEKKAGTR